DSGMLTPSDPGVWRSSQLRNRDDQRRRRAQHRQRSRQEGVPVEARLTLRLRGYEDLASGLDAWGPAEQQEVADGGTFSVLVFHGDAALVRFVGVSPGLVDVVRQTGSRTVQDAGLEVDGTSHDDGG